MKISNIQGLLQPSRVSPTASPAAAAPAAQNRDKVSISPAGKKKSARLQSLMKQRENLLARQEELRRKAKDKDVDPEIIQRSLQACQEQIRAVEQQISQEIRQQFKPEAEEEKKQEKTEPKTKEEVQQERIEQLTNLSASVSRAQSLQSLQAKLEGTADVRKAEIKTDKTNGEIADSMIRARDGSSPQTEKVIALLNETRQQRLSHKEAEVADLEQRAAAVASQAMEQLGNISQETAEAAETEDKPAARPEEKEGENQNPALPGVQKQEEAL